MAEGPSRTAFTILIVLVVVAAGATSAVVYVETRPPTHPTGLVVAVGDNVTVNYIGYLASGLDQGSVFDTSFWSVATNNASYPKSLEFEFRGSKAAYTQLGVNVGPSTPSGGYTINNWTFSAVVPGFWQGLVGLTGNVTHTITIPPSLGYGPKNPACVRTMPLTYTVPVFQTYSASAFAAQFPGITPSTGVTFAAPNYGWNATVYSANTSFVTVLNQPYVGYVSAPAGWPVLVTGISAPVGSSGAITLVNQLTDADAGRVAGKDFNDTTLCSSPLNQFIVSSVNAANGTYTEDFNSELTGETLIFIVTVVLIFPSSESA